MRTRILVISAAVAAALSCSSAMAGQFNVWTYNVDDSQTHIKVSFSGDGSTQDAQVDLTVPAGFEVAEAKVLVAGSVCAGSAESGILRAVPPSGAGTALTSKEVDYCSFVLKATNGTKPSSSFGNGLQTRMNECAGAGNPSCSVKIVDVSDNGARSGGSAGKPGSADKPGQERR